MGCAAAETRTDADGGDARRLFRESGRAPEPGSDLPAEPVNVIVEDNKFQDIIYIGTDNGIYTSFNRGKSFMNMNHQMPNVPVHDMLIQSRENELVVGTHGRSIFITKLDEVHKIFEATKK